MNVASSRVWQSRVVRGLLACVLLLVLLAGAMHLPPVRSLVLRTALGAVQGRAGLQIQVEDLDYNLFRLRATVSGVRLAATGTPDTPFFEAASIRVVLPASVLRGFFALRDVEIVDGRVTIVRTAAGSNLPSSPGGGGEPAAIPLGRLTGNLAVRVRDDVAAIDLRIPRLVLDVSPRTGRLAMDPSVVTWQGQVVTVTTLAGEVAFDGRSLVTRNVDLVTDIARVRLSGPLRVVTSTPGMDLQVAGTGDVARMAALATAEPVLDGQVAFDGRVTGPFGAPEATLQLSSSRLTRGELTLTDVRARARMDASRLDLSGAVLTVAEGTVNASGSLAFDGTASNLTAEWQRVDVAALLSSLLDEDGPVLPTGQAGGRLTAAGPGLDLVQWTTVAEIELAPAPNARGRLAAPGRTALALENGRWRLSGEHVVGGVAPTAIQLEGRLTAEGTPGPADGSIVVGDTRLPDLIAMLSTTGLASAADGLVMEGTVAVQATVAGELTSPTVDGTARITGVRAERIVLPAGELRFTGQPSTPDLGLTLTAPSLEVAGQTMAQVNLAGRLRARDVLIESLTAAEPGGTGTLTATGLYQFAGDAYELSARVANWRLAVAGVPAGGRATLDFSGAGRVAQPRGELRASVADATYQNVALGDLTVQATLDGEGADITLAAPRLALTGRGRTSLAAPYTATADFDLVGLEVETLRGLLVTGETSLTGDVSAALHVEGPLSRWRELDATLNVTAAEGMVGDLRVLVESPASVFYRAGLLGTVRFGVRAGAVQAEVRGSLPLEPTAGSAESMTASVIGDVGDVLAAVRSTRLVDVPALTGTGPVALLARVDGSVRAPEVSADLDLGPATINAPDLPPLERVRLLGRLEGGRVDVQDLFAAVEGAEVTATASAPVSWFSGDSAAGTDETATASARLKNVTAALLGRLATGSAVADLSGSLDASVEVSSRTRDLAGLAGEARIDRLDIGAAGLTIGQREPTRVVAENGFARIAAWEWSGEGTSLSVAGQVRLSNLQSGILANGEVDLRLLSPFLRDLDISTAGRVTPRLSITGALTRPRLDGDITLSSADVRVGSPRVFISGLDGRAIFSRDRLRIVSLGGEINGGTLVVGGEVLFPAEGTPSAEMTAEIDGMALEFPDGLRTNLAGSLRLNYVDVADGVPPVPVLSGNMRVLDGSYREPITVVGGVLAALQSRTGATPPLPPGSTPSLALDIALTTEQDIIVDNNAATLALDADVRLIGTVARPALSGRAEVREQGRVLLGRNTYQVVSGTLDFANPNRIDPQLNFQLATSAGGVPIDVTLTGTASEPMLALTSENTELTESDLTALLLTGRRLDQLGSADAALVGSVLVGNLSGEVGQVLGLAGRVVGLDSIRLGGLDGVDTMLQNDPTSIATATDPTSRLTFTKGIGSSLDVTFSQSLRDGEAQTWVVDYVPRRGLLARLVSNDQNLRLYEFRHDIQFGANTQTRVARAQTPRVVQRVNDVRLEGAPAGRDLRGLLRTRVGRVFDFQTLQDDRERLEQDVRGQGFLTARVRARQTPGGDGVVVAFDIEPGPPTRIELGGDVLPGDAADRIADLWADSIAGPLLVDEVQSYLRERLAGDGYFRPTVEATLGNEAGTQVLRVRVTRGTRTTEVSVAIEGVNDDLAEELNERLRSARLVARAPTDPGALAATLRQALAERGFSSSRVAVGSPVFEGASAMVTVQVDAGMAQQIGLVSVRGTRLDAGRVRGVLNLDEAMPYQQGLVDDAQARLLSFVRQEGFAAASVTVETQPGERTGTTDVTFVVEEGPRQVIAGVRVEGLRGIAQDVALRAMNLRVGEPARVEDIMRARTGLFGTGLFRRVEVTTSADESVDAAAAGGEPIRVLATVEEWPAVRFRYGVQAAEERPEEESRRQLVPGLSADATRRTLFGHAISVGAATVVQRRERLGRVFITSPTLVAFPLRTSFIVEKRREELPGTELGGRERTPINDTTSFSWEQRTTVARRLVLAYAYRFERTHSFVIGPEDPNFPAFDVSINVARLTASGAWDSRDDPSVPTRGSLVTASLENAPGSLGSQIRFVRVFGQARHFRSWRSVVLASAFQGGNVSPLGGQDVISTERFFTGGSTSIRGVPEDSAGERDFFGPVGGRVLLLLNQEVRFPLNRFLQGVAFVDAGNVFKEPREVSFGRLTTSVGLGLRVVTPFALLRVDYGQVVRGVAAGDPRARWIFGIGHAF